MFPTRVIIMKTRSNHKQQLNSHGTATQGHKQLQISTDSYKQLLNSHKQQCIYRRGVHLPPRSAFTGEECVYRRQRAVYRREVHLPARRCIYHRDGAFAGLAMRLISYLVRLTSPMPMLVWNGKTSPAPAPSFLEDL